MRRSLAPDVQVDEKLASAHGAGVALLIILLDLYTFVVFVRVVFSWINLSPYNPVVRFVVGLTEPVLAPLRRVVPAVGGFDLTPMLLLLLIQLVKRLLLGF
jgi:YggT family protein